MVNESVGLEGHPLLLHVQVSDSDLLDSVDRLHLNGGPCLERLHPAIEAISAVCCKCQYSISSGMFHL